MNLDIRRTVNESALRVLESSRPQLVKRKLDQGLVTYLELLDAQSQVLVSLQLALQNQVILYKALGGS
mgnify:FL=1